MTPTAHWQRANPDLKRFLIATFLSGLAASFNDSVFNNFLQARFDLGAWGRTFLEFPREIPGLLTVFFAAALFFIGSRRRAAVALLLCSIGMILMGTLSLSYSTMLIWLFIFSVGQHLWLPLSSSIGMELATSGADGRRLGQLNSIRNVAAILGAGVVFIAFSLFPLPLEAAFWMASFVFLIGAFVLARLTPDRPHRAKIYWKFPKRYRLYYMLTIIYGSRKQIFLTFAPWVLVSVLHQSVTVIATLLTIGGVMGILFQPLLGRAIDRFGERAILIAEAALLFVVCLAYAFGPLFLPEGAAFAVAATCYLLDQMLMSVSMARATYLKKIALTPQDVTPTLTMAVSVDHIFSISVALLGGLFWVLWGFWTVFLFGAAIAVVGVVASSRIRIEGQKAEQRSTAGHDRAEEAAASLEVRD